MAIRLVVFDMAGTTVKDENNVGNAFQTAMKKFGYEIPIQEVNPIMGYEKTLAIRRMLLEKEPDHSLITDVLVKDIHQLFVHEMITYYRNTPDLEPLPHVEETFIALHEEGIKIALNTGFSKDIADIIVERLEWKEKGLIDHMIASDEVEHGRPYPDMIRQLMEVTGIENPLEVAKIGDTEVDINEGKNAGCLYAIGITTGSFTRAELEIYSPTHIIDDIRELIEIINQPL